MNNLIDETGCRKMFTFSELGHDDDYFLTKDDMSESHWDLLMSCHHQGACDEDAAEAAKYFQFPSDEAIKNATEYLIECGIEESAFMQAYDEDGFSCDEDEAETHELDEDAVMLYYLWNLAGDIQERKDEE